VAHRPLIKLILAYQFLGPAVTALIALLLDEVLGARLNLRIHATFVPNLLAPFIEGAAVNVEVILLATS
jgi:hypothetical protein